MERVEWFANRNPFLPEIEELLDLGVFLPLKQKDDQHRQVFIIRKWIDMFYSTLSQQFFPLFAKGTAAHDPKTQTQNNVLKVLSIFVLLK